MLSHQKAIQDRFGIKKFDFEFTPRYNVAPQQKIPIVFKDTEVQLVGARWGLIPFWAKDPKIGNKMINARAETIAEKRVFIPAFKKRRCLIPASGFYEWQKIGKSKRPMTIRLQSQEVFALAGIYERWKSPTDKWILSCAIITTGPNNLMESIHKRMPVILRSDDEATWIDPDNDDLESLQSLLQPFSEDTLEAFEVSTYVNSPKNEGPMCIQPIDDEQQTLF